MGRLLVIHPIVHPSYIHFQIFCCSKQHIWHSWTVGIHMLLSCSYIWPHPEVCNPTHLQHLCLLQMLTIFQDKEHVPFLLLCGVLWNQPHLYQKCLHLSKKLVNKKSYYSFLYVNKFSPVLRIGKFHKTHISQSKEVLFHCISWNLLHEC